MVGIYKLAWEFLRKWKQWAKFVHARFYRNGKPINYYRMSSVWNGIRLVLPLLNVDTLWSIGNKSECSLWNDRWTITTLSQH